MSDSPQYLYDVRVLHVHDGDTVTVDVDCGFGVTFRTNVRLARINAPELATPEGKAARDFLRDLVAGQGTGQWTARTFKTGHEKYGRWLAAFTTPGGATVNDRMVEAGHAVPYLP